MSNLFTVREVAQILKCNTNRVYELIEAGVLPAIKIGRTKIREEALNDFLEKYEGLDITNPSNIREI